MAAFSNASEPFYEDLSNRSPRGFRGPQMNRQQVGRVDTYPGMQGMFGTENAIPSLRFGGNPRDQFAGLQGPGNVNMNFPYDVNAAQTWGSGGGPLPSFGGNGMNAMTQNGEYGPRGIKPSRGRAGINNVSIRRPLTIVH
jgi:hypothetical protein